MNNKKEDAMMAIVMLGDTKLSDGGLSKITCRHPGPLSATDFTLLLQQHHFGRVVLRDIDHSIASSLGSRPAFIADDQV